MRLLRIVFIFCVLSAGGVGIGACGEKGATGKLAKTSGTGNPRGVVKQDADGVPRLVVFCDRSWSVRDIKGWCHSSKVQDLSPLSKLTKLKEPSLLDAHEVSDLRPLSKLTKLEMLDLRNTKVSDLRPLSKLVNLKLLNLRGTKVIDLRPLSKLTKLDTLILGDTQVSDLRPLSKLTKLERMDLMRTKVRDLRPLSKLTSLKELDLHGTKVSKSQVDALENALPKLILNWP